MTVHLTGKSKSRDFNLAARELYISLEEPNATLTLKSRPESTQWSADPTFCDISQGKSLSCKKTSVCEVPGTVCVRSGCEDPHPYMKTLCLRLWPCRSQYIRICKIDRRGQGWKSSALYRTSSWHSCLQTLHSHATRPNCCHVVLLRIPAS